MSEEFYPEHEIHTDPVENQQTEQQTWQAAQQQTAQQTWQAAPQQPSSPAPEAKKKGGKAAKVVALLLACALVGGGSGFGAAALMQKKSAPASNSVSSASSDASVMLPICIFHLPDSSLQSLRAQDGGNPLGHHQNLSLRLPQHLLGQTQSFLQRVGRCHMQIPHHLIGSLTDQNHTAFHQHPGKDLGLPLIGLGLILRRGQDSIHDDLGIFSFPEGAPEHFSAVAILAPGGNDDDAAFPAGHFRGGHPLHRLIDVLIQRIAIVAGDHDIGLRRFLLAKGSQKFRTGPMSLIKISGKGPDHLALSAQHHDEWGFLPKSPPGHEDRQ